MATFDVNKALKDGYTMAEIQEYMTANNLQPIKTWGGFRKNVVESAIGAAKGIIQPLTQPVQTVKDLGNLAIGAAQLAIPGKQDKEKFAKALGQFYVDRYGSPEKALDTLYSDPVGALSDVSTFLTGGGAAISGIGKVSKLGGVAKTGQAVSRIGAMAEPLNIVGAGLGRLPGKGLMKRAGGKIEEMGREYAKTGYGQPATLGKYAQRYRPVEDVITEYGLYGKDTEKLAKTIDSIQNEFDKIAKRSGRQVKLSDLKGSIKNKIAELQTSGVLEDIKTADAIKERLNIFEKSLKKKVDKTIKKPTQETPKTVRVYSKSKFSNEGAYVDRPIIRKVNNITLYQGGTNKQHWTPNKKYASQFGKVKEKTGSFYQIDNGNRMTDVYVEAPIKSKITRPQAPKEIGVDLATEMRKKYDQRVKNWNEPVTDVDANRILRDIFQDEIRKATADLATAKGENLKRTGERLSELYALEPIMQQAAQRGTSTRAFSLGKMVTSGVGATMAGLPGAIAGYGLDVIANQPKVIGAASRATQKIGQAMQKGMPKIPALEKVGQGANIFYQAGKVGRVTAPAGKTETMPTMTPEEEKQKRIDDAILRYAPSYEKIKQKRTQVSPGNAFSKVGKVSKGSFV
jgi:hypothetical protein